MARSSADESRSYVSHVLLVGHGRGLVKKLPAFDRSRHVVPDAVNPATSAFLGRLISAELAGEAEDWFQRTREALAYKRKDLTLTLATPTAVLAAKDFEFEIAYALDDAHPAEFVIRRTLQQVRDPEVLQREAFDTLFAGQFSDVLFQLKRGVRVEDVVDAVEALEDGAGLRVNYPSDCRTCTLTVEGVEATVLCDGGTLTLQFPRNGSPRELLEAFTAVREAFALSKQRALTGLLG